MSNHTSNCARRAWSGFGAGDGYRYEAVDCQLSARTRALPRDVAVVEIAYASEPASCSDIAKQVVVLLGITFDGCFVQLRTQVLEEIARPFVDK